MRSAYAHDKRLVRRLLSGDEDAYDELFTVQVPRLFRMALTRLDNDPMAAEEVVQNILVKAMPKLRTYRGEASLLTWLGTFCFHEVSAVYRQRRRADDQVQLSEEIPEIAAALELLEADGDPEKTSLRSELVRLVHATLDRLPNRYGDVLEWKYIEGLSVKEIAARLETGPTAVQSILARARQAFRRGFSTVGAEITVISPPQTARTRGT